MSMLTCSIRGAPQLNHRNEFIVLRIYPELRGSRTFAPEVKGKRSASLQVSDDAGGRPQKVALLGDESRFQAVGSKSFFQPDGPPRPAPHPPNRGCPASIKAWMR